MNFWWIISSFPNHIVYLVYIFEVILWKREALSSFDPMIELECGIVFFCIVFWPCCGFEHLCFQLHCLPFYWSVCSSPPCVPCTAWCSSEERSAEVQGCFGWWWRGNRQADLWSLPVSAALTADLPPKAQLGNLWEQAACGCRSRSDHRGGLIPVAAEGPGWGAGYGSSCMSWP